MRFTENRIGMFIETAQIPGHKKPVLIVGNGSKAEYVATFRNEWQEIRFKEFMQRFFDALDVMEEKE